MLHIFHIEYLKYRKTMCVHHSAYMHVYYRNKAVERNPIARQPYFLCPKNEIQLFESCLLTSSNNCTIIMIVKQLFELCDWRN